MNLFELFVKIGVDDQASKKIETLSEKLGKGLQNAAKVAKAAMAVVGTGIVSLGKIGLEYNAQIESYTTDFEVMMGDAESAARKVEELKKMGAKTPFELGDLASATKTLLAFNVSADDSTGVLQQLGDISLGNVQKLESLTRAYGKMNASQKVTLEDINMMIDAGFNPLLLVAENTGETMEEVYDRISKGGVAFEEITGAINQATSEGGQFYQGMDKASQTTQGLISTLKDASQSKIGELFSNISEKIKELLPNVISFIENIDTDEIVTGVENLMQAFNDLLPVITGVTAATVAYKAATSIAGIIDALRKATEGQTIAQTLLNAVMNANPFVLIATLIAGLVTAIITLWNTNDGFREAVIGIWESIKGAFVGAWEAIKAAWSVVKDFFADIWNGIKSTFSVVGNTIGGFFTDAWEKTKQGWSAAGNFFSNVWGGIKRTFSVVGNVLGSFFTEAWNKIKSAFSSWKNFFSNLWSQVKNVFSGAGSWFLSIGKDIVNGVWSGIQSMVSWFTSKVKSFFSGIVNSVKNVLGIHSPSKVFASIGGYMAEGLGEGWDDKFSDVRDEIDKSLDFDDPSIRINASVHKIGTDAAGISGMAYRGTSIGTVIINIDGAKYTDEQSLAEAMAESLQNMTDRRAAVYA